MTKKKTVKVSELEYEVLTRFRTVHSDKQQVVLDILHIDYEQKEPGKLCITTAALPASVKGVSAWDRKENRYIVMINNNITQEEQQEALKHEIRHIENNDHKKPTGTNVNVIEIENRKARNKL